MSLSMYSIHPSFPTFNIQNNRIFYLADCYVDNVWNIFVKSQKKKKKKNKKSIPISF